MRSWPSGVGAGSSGLANRSDCSTSLVSSGGADTSLFELVLCGLGSETGVDAGETPAINPGNGGGAPPAHPTAMITNHPTTHENIIDPTAIFRNLGCPPMSYVPRRSFQDPSSPPKRLFRNL
ncbi:MAG: hypothetical protein Kow0047_04210 [Anaerolineae bacterium]